MHHTNFLDSLGTLPKPADPELALRGREDFSNAINTFISSSDTDKDITTQAKDLLNHSSAPTLLDAVFGNSPFLTWCALGDPAFTLNLLSKGPDWGFESTLKTLTDKRKETLNDASAARELRIAKRRVALSIAIADISNTWELEKVIQSISEFADTALSLAATHVLKQAAESGAFELKNRDNPEQGSGLVILGMGKLGARELNYSSDIDLIILFNPDDIVTDKPDRLQNNFVRLTRALVKLMEERTGDGYVFRTDLRLRPDPGATPIAISTYAAETYYESLGQNWERAAMIKARPVAGDLDAGNRFLRWLTPFVWRKSLDFAAIQDIQSIKRQINAHKGGETMSVPGHNIKLGRGGIREIEFFAQTQQLIWGGREPGLRSRVTLESLSALAGFGTCEAETADELSRSYRFLRTLEHRLQMINDEQTQTLPTDGESLRHLAVFSGYSDATEFLMDVLGHLRSVHDHYANLFKDTSDSEEKYDDRGNLVFTGSDADPDTLKTLEGLGYRNADTVDATVRAWHHGRYRSVRSTRAQEILTELMPALLSAIGKSPDPDTTFLRFDEFLRGLPAGVQLFSMFQTHPRLFDLVAEIMGKAPRLARHLAGRPSVLDGVLAPDFFNPPPDKVAMLEDLSVLLDRAEYEEDILNFSRRWANDRRFQIGVQRLQGLIDPPTASGALSDIAETSLTCLYPHIEAKFAQKHGRIKDASMVVLALGKLGSREMNASSDLDLVFICAAPDFDTPSDGDKPLHPTQYFARLGQRYINAISAMTPEGTLYEVDMRLRPSGNSGPIATTLEAFKKYQIESAWTWEHMALTRARVVSGPSKLKVLTEETIRSILTELRDNDKLLRDVSDMRNRLLREKPGDELWSLKHLRGGIVDIEFITQYLSLRHANAHPDILCSSTTKTLNALGQHNVLAPEDINQLVSTLKLWHGLQGMLSLTIEEEMTTSREAEMSEALKADLATIGRVDNFTQLEDKVREQAAQIYGIYQRLIEEPASALQESDA